MGGVLELLTALKQEGHTEGRFLGLLHILIGRRLQKKDGTVISTGLTWRELSGLFASSDENRPPPSAPAPAAPAPRPAAAPPKDDRKKKRGLFGR